MELPYRSIEFAEAWQEWLDYKLAEFKHEYKPRGLKMTLKKLVRYSYNDERLAISIIEDAISRNWQGFYPLQERDPLMIEYRKRQKEESKPKTAADIIFEKYGFNS